MRTTVVIASRNGGARLLRTLRHLQGLAEPPPVIVVDNGSDDGTGELVADVHPGVRLIRVGCNLGACARTLGVHAATTPFVAFAADDSWWADGALIEAEAAFDAHPRLGLLAASIRVGDDEDPVCAVMRASPIRDADLPGPIVLGFAACGAVVRREAYLEAGGFHPLLHAFGEETLLAQDLAACGWHACHVDRVVAERAPDLHVDRRARRARGLRNAVLSAWLRRPVHIAILRTARLLRPRDHDARLALGEVLRRLPVALRSRRRLPASVEAAMQAIERTHVPDRAPEREPSAQVRPQLKVVPAIGPHLRAAQHALEQEAGPLEGSLLADVRDVG